MPVETLLGAAALAVVKPAAKKAALSALTRAQDQFQAAADDAFQEMTAEAAARITQLAAQGDDHTARLTLIEQVLGTPECLGVIRNYWIEVRREPIRARISMLSAAAAETANPDIEAGKKARVERVIRELDPRDVLELDMIAGMELDPGTSGHTGVRSHRGDAWFSSPSRDELEAAGCIRLEVTKVDVTQRGHDVLAVMHPWVERERWKTRPADWHNDHPEVLAMRLARHRDAQVLLRLRTAGLEGKSPNGVSFETFGSGSSFASWMHFANAVPVLVAAGLARPMGDESYSLTDRGVAAAMDRGELDRLVPL